MKSLRLKQDKWNKLIISDEQRSLITNFVEKGRGFFYSWLIKASRLFDEYFIFFRHITSFGVVSKYWRAAAGTH